MSVKNIEIFHSIVFDFLASLIRLANIDDFTNKDISGNVKQNEEIKLWVEKTISEFPEDKKKQLKLYFSSELKTGIKLSLLIIENNIKDIWEFIKKLETFDEIELIHMIISGDFFTEKSVISIEEIRECVGSSEKAFQFIDKKLLVSPQQKWDFMQFFNDPSRVKNELMEFLKWYYVNIFIHQEDELDSFTKSYEKQLETKLKRTDDNFIKHFTKTDPVKDLKVNKVNIGVSYYLEKFALNLFSDTINEEIFIAGYEYIENQLSGTYPIKQAFKIFKTLADETRLNIIKLLAMRPWYGTELAEELKLTNATISHHLSLLLSRELVTVERVDNKIYVSLNKDKFINDIKNTIDDIFK